MDFDLLFINLHPLIEGWPDFNFVWRHTEPSRQVFRTSFIADDIRSAICISPKRKVLIKAGPVDELCRVWTDNHGAAVIEINKASFRLCVLRKPLRRISFTAETMVGIKIVVSPTTLEFNRDLLRCVPLHRNMIFVGIGVQNKQHTSFRVPPAKTIYKLELKTCHREVREYQ